MMIRVVQAENTDIGGWLQNSSDIPGHTQHWLSTQSGINDLVLSPTLHDLMVYS